MKTEKAVRDMLDQTLTDTLTAHRLYFIHDQIATNWGHEFLARHFRNQTEAALHSSQAVVQRILALKGFPNINSMHMVQNGETCRQQLQLQHDFETKLIKNLSRRIQLCIDHDDQKTRNLLNEILEISKRQIEWLETQRQKIRDIGVDSYLMEYAHA